MSNQNLHTISDLALVALIDEGGENAFEELYNRYWQILYNEAFRRLGDIEKSKDIIQDVFMQFWEKTSRGHVLDVGSYLKQSVRFHVIRSYNQSRKLNNFELPIETINGISLALMKHFSPRNWKLISGSGFPSSLNVEGKSSICALSSTRALKKSAIYSKFHKKLSKKHYL